MFDLFAENLRRRLDGELPGLDAQLRMAPQARIRQMPSDETLERARKAAVLVLLYPVQNTPHLVLMKRVSYPGVHSAQVSFPGGQVEPTDTDLVHTALREAEEEVGVISNDVEIVGQMSRLYIPPSNFLVQPVVGISESRPAFEADRSEVDRIIEVPVAHFLDPANQGVKKIDGSSGIRFTSPYYDVDGHVVWGATAMMLAELSEIIDNTLR